MQYFQTGENNLERRRVYLHLVDATDGITAETGEVGQKAKLSFNGQAATNSINSLVAIDSTNQPGTYYLELSTSEIVHPGILIVRYKSANTAEFVQTCQIMAFDPYTQFGTLGGGGGADVDYKRIEKLIAKAVGDIPTPTFPEVPTTDLAPLQTQLQAVLEAIRSIRIPESKDVDLSSVIAEIKAVGKALAEKEIPATDLSPVLAAIGGIDLSSAIAEINQTLERIRQFFGDDVDEIKDILNKIQERYDKIPLVAYPTLKEREQVTNDDLDDGL